MPKMTELGPTVRGIAEVDGNEFRLRIIVGLATGQPNDLPIIFAVEVTDHVAANDAGGPNHESDFLVGHCKGLSLFTASDRM